MQVDGTAHAIPVLPADPRQVLLVIVGSDPRSLAVGESK
jgi:hypothetical protein